MTSQDCDFLVIGSGAAGLCAAATAAVNGLDVIVAERAAVLGGTTAWSGGWMWLPGHGLGRAPDTADEDAMAARQYLQSVLGNRFNAKRIDGFIESVREMVAFLTSAGFEFEAGNGICDIYADRPGAGTGGRSLIAAPFNARILRGGIAMLRDTKRETSVAGMPIQAGADLKAFQNAFRKPAAFWHTARRLIRHTGELAVHRRAVSLRNGTALIARLYQIADQHNTRWMTDSAATRLLTKNGRVIGAELSTVNGTIIIRARRGVLLATGGFSQNAAMLGEYFAHSGDHSSLAVPEADGSGASLAQSVGAAFDADVNAAGAWCPVSQVTWPDGRVGVFPHIIDRGKPGVIAVRANGERFVNEADGYHDYVAALLAATPADEAAISWLICDHRFIRRWGLGVVKPAPFPMRYWIRSGYLRCAATIGDLAVVCGIDAKLTSTVAQFNTDAANGVDSQFGRGWSPYNRAQGDAEISPNPNVAPIKRGPFYAVAVHPGSFGSFAGLKCDADARVLRADGTAISGLFSAGADMVSVMGGYYPAGGINLGPAMVFGFRAAQAAQRAGA